MTTDTASRGLSVAIRPAFTTLSSLNAGAVR
jgi:hypothetical protein